VSRKERPEEGFLARWSRLKREPGQPDAPITSPDAAPAESQTVPAPAPAVPHAQGQAALDDMLAALPKLEDLVPGQDLSMFMRAGVPVELRNQALRRMWTIDPAVRDFVSEALDYAHDYNTPGAAPGFGPLTPGRDEVRAVLDMFDRMVAGDGPTEASPPAVIGQDNMSQAGARPAETARSHAALPQVATPRQDDPASHRPETHEGAGATSEDGATSGDSGHAAAHKPEAEAARSPAPKRRHGGALPG
jgi:Protein of unknown function (DUF3306)